MAKSAKNYKKLGEIRKNQGARTAGAWHNRAQPSGVAGSIHWVKGTKPVVVTRGLSPLLPNELVTATVI
ncbi:MAG: hypothetical protein BJG00_009975 [Limnothrix sp. CACIAM 69d]|nr:MAG: hypothetical protein BJG00_009975 [Limnothrix sp. CACIAM 69d]